MIQELDTVVLKHDIREHGLKAGDIGAVALSHGDGEAFEVEFVTGEGETVAVLTLRAQELRSMQAQEILHARELVA